MIEKIVIKFFQSHENTNLTLSPFVNVITGRSQAGKSGILRALYWAIENRPSGMRFKSHFAEEDDSVKVMVKPNDHPAIWHNKGSSGHGYLLGKKTFEKVGKKVPDVIKQALNFSELNIQKQLDLPFLITGSGGEIAKTINRITRLEKVDEWTSALTSIINQHSRDGTRLTNEILEINEKLQHYRQLKHIRAKVEDAKKVELSCEVLAKKCEKIETAIEHLEQIQAGIDSLDNIDEIESLLEKAEEKEESMAEIKDQTEKVETLLQIERQLSSLVERDKILKKAYDVSNEIQRVMEQMNVTSQAISICANYDKVNEKHIKAKETFVKALLKWNKCPMCTQPVTEDVIQEIVETL